MDKLYEYARDGVVNFKLERCCCVAPIRIGLLVTGYFNVFMALLFLVSVADDGITPPLMAVQNIILDDDSSKPLGVLAYSAELAFNTLLLCGMYRNDLVLLRVYMYFMFASIISSLLVYSIVIAGISVLIKILIIWNLAFQCYVIILVRSAIVEIKETQTSEKNGHVTLYSVVRMPDEVPKTDERGVDVESVSQNVNDDIEHPEQKKDEPPTKLETVNESSKE